MNYLLHISEDFDNQILMIFLILISTMVLIGFLFIDLTENKAKTTPLIEKDTTTPITKLT